MSDLKTQFENAVNTVKTAEGDFKPSQELKLQMYGLFKQATKGDVHGNKPGALDFVGKVKYDTWEKLKGMSAEEAMSAYVEKFDELNAKLS